MINKIILGVFRIIFLGLGFHFAYNGMLSIVLPLAKRLGDHGYSLVLIMLLVLGLVVMFYLIYRPDPTIKFDKPFLEELASFFIRMLSAGMFFGVSLASSFGLILQFS